ncbi:hypothetical protein FB451DRAFT_1386465 [Mycena latifolia]|nr:hypothetical protein FB451DRAFT_1386465 [Mycena latifolia]
MYLNTMAVPVRHPWFDKPSMKRKHPSEDSSWPSSKRRRSSTLERGFANLTLDAPMYPVDAVIPIVDEPPSPRPATPTVPEITMKASSWYEPEPDRIVVTDLDSQSDDEADDDVNPLISPALIEQFKTRPLQSNLLPVQSHSQALVLFRPLIPPKAAAHEVGKDADADKDGGDKDDAMDVEP